MQSLHVKLAVVQELNLSVCHAGHHSGVEGEGGGAEVALEIMHAKKCDRAGCVLLLAQST